MSAEPVANYYLTLNNEDVFLTSGVARVLGCSPDNVRYLERTGQLQAIRIGGMRVFRRADVLALRDRRREERGGAA